MNITGLKIASVSNQTSLKYTGILRIELRICSTSKWPVGYLVPWPQYFATVNHLWVMLSREKCVVWAKKWRLKWLYNKLTVKAWKKGHAATNALFLSCQYNSVQSSAISLNPIQNFAPLPYTLIICQLYLTPPHPLVSIRQFINPRIELLQSTVDSFKKLTVKYSVAFCPSLSKNSPGWIAYKWQKIFYRL